VDLLAEGMNNLHVEDSNDEEDDLFMTFIATLEMQVDGANQCPAVRKTTALTTEKLIEKLKQCQRSIRQTSLQAFIY
jgi:hypothetical protein